MASVEVDVQELSELLFGAKERYRSAQATITHTVDAPLAEEANRRFVDWHFAQDNPGMGIIRKPGPPAREDFYEDYEDTKEVINLWHERPDLWREERWNAGGELLRCVVFGSARGPRWVYEPPETAFYIPASTEEWSSAGPSRTAPSCSTPLRSSSTTPSWTMRPSTRRAGGRLWLTGRPWRLWSGPSLGATRQRSSTASLPSRALNRSSRGSVMLQRYGC
jgi:hypothetical protein